MDKVGRPGPEGPEGKVLRDLGALDPLWPWPEEAIVLYNFNIDGNLLKDEHKQALDELAAWVKDPRNQVHLRLIGTASKSGEADYNQQLSLERVLRVKKYLLAQRLTESQVPGEQMRAYGESRSTSSSEEDEMDRAVRIEIHAGRLTKPIPVKRPDPQDFTSMPWLIYHPDPPTPDEMEIKSKKTFFMRHVLAVSAAFGSDKTTLGSIGKKGVGVSAGAGVGPTVEGFEIMDAETGVVGRFLLSGVSVGAGLSVNLGKTSIGGTAPGEGNPWSEIVCDHQSVSDFEWDFGIYRSAGGGPWTFNIL